MTLVFCAWKKPTCSALNWKVWVKPLIIYLPAWCTFHSYASKWAFYWILLQDTKFWQETVENEWSQLHFGYMDYCHSNMLLLILKSLDDCVSMETAGRKYILVQLFFQWQQDPNDHTFVYTIRFVFLIYM